MHEIAAPATYRQTVSPTPARSWVRDELCASATAITERRVASLADTPRRSPSETTAIRPMAPSGSPSSSDRRSSARAPPPGPPGYSDRLVEFAIFRGYSSDGRERWWPKPAHDCQRPAATRSACRPPGTGTPVPARSLGRRCPPIETVAHVDALDLVGPGTLRTGESVLYGLPAPSTIGCTESAGTSLQAAWDGAHSA